MSFLDRFRLMKDEPLSVSAPPAPPPLAGTLPGSSIAFAELDAAGADALATKGLAQEPEPPDFSGSTFPDRED